MKQFNLSLHNDILKLRQLGNSSPDEHKKLLDEICDKYKLSKATIYRELGKPKPGTYRKRNHKPCMTKITNLELELVTEMMLARKNDEQIRLEMSIIKGFDYSRVRLAKAKQKISHASQMIMNPKPKVVHHIHDPKLVDGMKISNVTYIRADGKDGVTPKNTNLPCYEGNASKFFYALAGIDTKDPDGIQKLTFPGGEVHYVKNSVIKGHLDGIAASSEAGGKSKEEAVTFSIDVLLRNQLNSAVRRGYITPLELRQLTSTTKALTQIRNSAGASGGNYSFDEVMHIVGVFSPGATREHVAKIIASHPFLDRTRNKPIPSYVPTPAYQPTPTPEENLSEACLKTTVWEEGGKDEEINCDDEFSTAIGNNRRPSNHHANHVEKTGENNG